MLEANKLDEWTSPTYPIHAIMNKVTAFLTFEPRKSFELNQEIEWHSFHVQVVYNWVEMMDNPLEL